MPTLIDQGTGGSIIITSSMAGEMGLAGISHYTAAKHAVMGLMRSLVNEVSAVRDPRQLREPDDSQHRHDPQRRLLPVLPGVHG